METSKFEDWLNEFNPPTFSIESGKWVLGSDAKAAILAAHRAAVVEARRAVFDEYKLHEISDSAPCQTCGKPMYAWPSVQGVWTELCRNCDVSSPAEAEAQLQEGKE